MVSHALTAGVAAGAYLLGSVPTALLVARRRGIDIRTVGSGNIGAANAARTLGKRLGAVVLAGDVLKGFVPAALARFALDLPPLAVAIIGFAAFLGHLFPIYLRFRGGKGVATAAGIFLAMTPIPALVAAAAWLLVFLVTRIPSASSVVAVLAFPLALVWLRVEMPYFVCAMAVVALILVKHRGNIARLARRRERGI